MCTVTYIHLHTYIPNKYKNINLGYSNTSIIPTLGGWRQGNPEFKVSLYYLANLRPAWLPKTLPSQSKEMVY